MNEFQGRRQDLRVSDWRRDARLGPESNGIRGEEVGPRAQGGRQSELRDLPAHFAGKHRF